MAFTLSIANKQQNVWLGDAFEFAERMWESGIGVLKSYVSVILPFIVSHQLAV